MTLRLYVLHYKKNYSRKAYLRENKPESYDYTFIEKGDKGEFAQDRYYKYERSRNIEAIRKIYSVLSCNIRLARGEVIERWPYREGRGSDLNMERMTPGVISLTNLSLNIKHRYAWAELLRSGEDYAIIVEDDIVFTEETVEALSTIITSEAYSQYDYIDIAGGAGLSVNGSKIFRQDPGVPNLFEVETRSTRTTCGYIMNKRLAAQLLLTTVPIIFPIDFQLTYLFSIIKPRVAWCHSPPFVHGSEAGFYTSTNER
ncbi:glycosyltransferase family 25 protein [Synechococcus sp. BS55D]|uniref:glycosyltransferase family 25 protein n=1 Tax=Synechococcus sp. BS55D TaxID=2055943 RepID=UPI0010390B9D|nr:glycosyltransferase family 25 protein [Synechococcus sp. BS55D]